MASGNNTARDIRRIGGRLHVIDEIRDEAGKAITRLASPLHVELRWQDLVQLFAGALMLATPIAVTEEVWDLGESLSAGNILLIAGLSFLVNAFFVKILFYPGDLPGYRFEYFKRIVASYSIALLTALLLLELFDKGLIDDPVVALKRAVIIALPASFAATAVDYIR
jgi:uncharacterized membrane protein